MQPRVRPRSRRADALHIVERRPGGLPSWPDPNDVAAQASAALVAAGRWLSALRAPLRTAGVDLRTARALLCFYGRRPLRIADLAWDLAITSGAASRLADDLEEGGLVDKLYDRARDRRATLLLLTSAGRMQRAAIDDAIRALETTDRPRGAAWGIRAYLESLTPPGAPRGYRVP